MPCLLWLKVFSPCTQFPSPLSLSSLLTNPLSVTVALLPMADPSAHSVGRLAGLGRTLESAQSGTETLMTLLDTRLVRVVSLKYKTMQCLGFPLLLQLKLALSPKPHDLFSTCILKWLCASQDHPSLPFHYFHLTCHVTS